MYCQTGAFLSPDAVCGSPSVGGPERLHFCNFPLYNRPASVYTVLSQTNNRFLYPGKESFK